MWEAMLKVREATDANPWDIHLVRRTGAPPIRISGRPLFHHSKSPYLDAELFLSIFQLRKGGFVVSHSVLSQFEWESFALRVASLEDAMSAVESYCADLADLRETLGRETAVTVEGLIEAMTLYQRRTGQIRAFLALAGEALAAWDLWQHTSSYASIR